jgi:hypothetical protein
MRYEDETENRQAGGKKSGDRGVGEYVGGLFGNAERSADFAVALAIADAFGDLPEAGRE